MVKHISDCSFNLFHFLQNVGISWMILVMIRMTAALIIKVVPDDNHAVRTELMVTTMRK